MIEQLVAHINTELNWGAVETWTNKDFEQLSERIWERTHKRLSVTTLKRVWGRAEQISQPSQTTLDILAEFGGFKNWRNFTQQQSVAETSKRKRSEMLPARFPRFAALGMLLAAVGIMAIFWNRQPDVIPVPAPAPLPDGFRFKKKVIGDGIPNSVVFTYDASMASPDAVIEIQQDWDDRKRIPLSREDSIATSIYYRPGYFKAKLVVDSQIVAEDDVLIQTRDWLGVVEQEPVPIYLPNEEVRKKEGIVISTELLKPYDVDPMQADIITTLYKVTDLGALYTNDFVLDMEVQHTLDKPRRRCRGIQIYLIFDGGAISIPLADKGCVANLNVMTFEEFVGGDKHDLSAFGVDPTVPQSVRMHAQDSTLQVFINEKSVFQMPIPADPMAIKGLAIYFEGTGMVRNVRFSNSEGREIEL